MSLQNLRQSRYRFLILLGLILGLFVIEPIMKRFVAGHIFLSIFETAIVISMAYAVSNKKNYLIVGVFLAVVMLASLWITYASPNKSITAIGMIAGALLVVLVIINLVDIVLKSTEVTREIVHVAVLLYLLIGLLWAFLYMFVEIVDSTSFNVELIYPERDFLVFQYYSFVTLTTLGFGDIVPVTGEAKSLTVLEALVGQLYLVVAIAWLVGMHVSRRSK